MAIYMNYDGIKGDVTEAGHEEWIRCSSLSFSALREAETGHGQASQRQGSDVSISDITLTKPMCAGSPHLFTASVVGFGKKVQIHITKTGESQQTNYLEMTLENCCVTNYGIVSDGVSHSETLTLNFLKISMTHKAVKEDGSAGGNNTVSFDIAKGEAG
jgi:type VI secretion system secreted protein Hcp